MGLDFSKLTSGNTVDSVLEPREIFRALPNRNRKYVFPRDVQSEVWKQWFERRSERDLVLKLNTGSGKTVVGLVILKSCLNEGYGPAVYVAPSPYLAKQAAKEGAALGLRVTEDLDAPDFLAGRTILITTVKKVFNGRSRFGVGPDGPRIEIGSLAVDDAHACLQECEEQFTLSVRPGPVFDELFEVFRPGLEQQSQTRVLEIENGEPNARMLVPFWEWHANLPKVARVLQALRDQDEAKFQWPLVKDVLAECQCVIGSQGAEIAPRILPVDLIPSFHRAKRRVFMGATFTDDSVLVSHFDVTSKALERAVVPNSANDIGDRMILVPQGLNPLIRDEQLRDYLATKARDLNVVVIVPSHNRAAFWKEVASQVLSASNLDAGVEALRARVVGLTVIVNRYDGIDLPDDACRILVIDGLPDVRRQIDKIEQGIRHGSELINSEAMQRIEQGMGRGNRSADDWCVVLLMGRTLTAHLYRGGAKKKFTAATRAQWELSEQVANQLVNAPIDAIDEAVLHCLNRSPNWIEPSRGVLVGLKYPADGRVDEVVQGRRQAFGSARIGDLHGAVAQCRAASEASSDPATKGWLLSEVAHYEHRLDAGEAQQTLRAAKRMNPLVVTPLTGVAYIKLSTGVVDQAARCLAFLNDQYDNGNELLVGVHALLDDVKFEPETARKFEAATARLGELLGFETQRPESEVGRGPDVLWKLGGLRFAVIEAKNGAVSDRISKGDCNQLAGAMNWFRAEYDTSCELIPVMVHPSNRVADNATAPSTARVVNVERIKQLCDAVRAFAVAVSAKTKFGTTQDISRLLVENGLTGDLLFNRHALEMK